jgi:hypothetical protein
LYTQSNQLEHKRWSALQTQVSRCIRYNQLFCDARSSENIMCSKDKVACRQIADSFLSIYKLIIMV